MALSFKPPSLEDVKEAYLCGAEDYAHISESINPWHKVSAELPKENYPVVIAFRFKGEWCYDKGYYADGEWSSDCLCSCDVVEYWMEIPELPKED